MTRSTTLRGPAASSRSPLSGPSATTAQTRASVDAAVDAVVQVRDLVIGFGRGANTPAVRGVSFDIAAGEIVALVGESGSGKSTTASALLGLLPGDAHIDEGHINIDGIDVTSFTNTQWRRLRGKRVGFVPQDPLSGLDPVHRVGAQIEEAFRAHHRVTRAQAQATAVTALGAVGIDDPELRARQYPHQFSGGMRQRALIAAGLVNAPGLLIADEPTSALDVTVQRAVLDRLEALVSETGSAILLITHDLELAAERADRVIVMKDGEIVESGAAGDVLASPTSAYTRTLVDAARVELHRPAPRSQQADAREPADARASAPRQPILAASALSRVYKSPGRRRDVTAVDGVSFELHGGRTLAIVGESGSGKSTTASLALGLETPTSGAVRFEGAEVARLRGAALKRFRRSVQPVFQDPYASLDPLFTVERILSEPLSAFNIVPKSERPARVAELLRKVSLAPELAHRYPKELSGGQRQRVAIARALAAEPRVIVCDEPVSALDVVVQQQVLELLLQLQSDLGLTLLFISHDLRVVRNFADDVAVMHRGRVVEAGPVELLDAPQHDYTRALLAAVPGRRLRQPRSA